MVHTIIDHRSDVACGSSHILNILTSLLWLKRVYKPWKIAVEFFFTITMRVLDFQLSVKFLGQWHVGAKEKSITSFLRSVIS